jgi:hypothetical protein
MYGVFCYTSVVPYHPVVLHVPMCNVFIFNAFMFNVPIIYVPGTVATKVKKCLYCNKQKKCTVTYNYAFTKIIITKTSIGTKNSVSTGQCGTVPYILIAATSSRIEELCARVESSFSASTAITSTDRSRAPLVTESDAAAIARIRSARS